MMLSGEKMLKTITIVLQKQHTGLEIAKLAEVLWPLVFLGGNVMLGLGMQRPETTISGLSEGFDALDFELTQHVFQSLLPHIRITWWSNRQSSSASSASSQDPR